MRALWLVAVALVGIAVFLWLDAREPRRRAPDRDGLIEETPPDRTGAGPDADREARLVVVGRDPDAADRLRLEVIDESGAPFPTEISLWRLGRDRDTWIGKRAAPWDANVGEGTYRAICLAARRDIPDPPPFLVRGRTHVRLVAPRPRDSEVLLRVYRADGRPVKRGLLAIRGRNRQVRDPRPDWLRPRQADVIEETAHAPNATPGRVQLDGGSGFLVGTAKGDTHATAHELSARFSIPGHSTVRIRAKGDAQGPQTLVAVVVPLRTLLRFVRLPDHIDASVVAVEAYCFAERDTAWDRVPVSVGVDVPGYRHLRFEYVVAAPPTEPFAPTTEPSRPPR